MDRFFRSGYGSYALVVGGLMLALAGLVFLPNWSGFAAEAREEAGPYWAANLQGRGERLYTQNCATCHGGNGEGIAEVFPPLQGSQVVNDVGPWTAMLVLHGRGAMPGFDHILDDEEMAAVISYVRTSWGNAAGPVSPSLIKQMRVQAFEPEH